MADDLLNSLPDKVILVGDVGVGKTSIFTRFRTGEFDPPGGDQKIAEFQKSWLIDGKKVSITMFDTAGMERHMSTIPHTYFREAKLLLIVYSIDETESFDSLDSWLGNASSARTAAGEEPLIVALVGNKIDLPKREVTKARAKELAELYEIPSDLIFEVSALDDTNIQTMFDVIATKIQPAAKKSTEKATKPPSNRSRSIC